MYVGSVKQCNFHSPKFPKSTCGSIKSKPVKDLSYHIATEVTSTNVNGSFDFNKYTSIKTCQQAVQQETKH